ncbi:MAG: hypothetical protein WKG00_32970 [Polyangiaceae bacterium]
MAYLSCSSGLTDFYPHAAPDQKRYHWVQPSHPDFTCWNSLNVGANETIFVYSVVAGGPGETPPTPPGFPAIHVQTRPWFVAYAVGDQDGDGQLSRFWTGSMVDGVKSAEEWE